MAGAVRSRGVSYGQLVLFAALLFGIVTMHTVGHPAEHGGRAASLSSAGPVADSSSVTAEHFSAIAVADSSPVTAEGPSPDSSSAVMRHASAAAVVAHPSAADTSAAIAASSSPGAAHAPDHGSGGDAPTSGMDPLSVCLAVLGAWGLALLAAWLLLGMRADGRRLGTPVGAGLLRAARTNPPPSISVLAAVSVLRM
ncbi:hypothetical protein [Streptomyces californicus]|uniref:hypothetical protein n=1 Tax=Streptomyces californicus TaxID=67351 RepID=UPI0036C1C71F